MIMILKSDCSAQTIYKDTWPMASVRFRTMDSSWRDVFPVAHETRVHSPEEERSQPLYQDSNWLIIPFYPSLDILHLTGDTCKIRSLVSRLPNSSDYSYIHVFSWTVFVCWLTSECCVSNLYFWALCFGFYLLSFKSLSLMLMLSVSLLSVLCCLR